ncbi:WecB/TagA/CpsF family glycosyltransferase [Patescibacteria group bacterium]|nr:WecB/TagA/CpsF family glycosyltransferase [Patescibacteria group bacterium]
MQRNVITLLGVPIDRVTSREAVDLLLQFMEPSRLKRFFHLGGQHHVMTPNSEMLVEATRNKHFKKILQSTSLNIPDSVGLLYMARLTGNKFPERVTGIDTVTKLFKKLNKNHSVFLLGGEEGVAVKAAKKMKSINPQLKIVGTHAGSPSDKDSEEIVAKIQKAKPHLLLVAFGAPKQDLWIAKYLKDLPSVRVAMGVGGTFDFITGKQKRAPRWMRNLGLEWLGRLVREPKRVGRIFKAVVVFPVLVLFYKK